jgi:hypothetical protein
MLSYILKSALELKFSTIKYITIQYNPKKSLQKLQLERLKAGAGVGYIVEVGNGNKNGCFIHACLWPC